MSVSLSGRWTDENRAVLEQLLAREFHSPPIAVFDWDNACIQGDIADATFHHLCADLMFKFDAPGFWEWMGEAGLENRVRVAYEAYRLTPTEDARHALRIALELTREALHQGEDDTSAWAWDSGAFIGWTPYEAREYTKKVMRQEMASPFETEIILLDDGSWLTLSHGLRVRTEIKELIAALQRANWQVFVITASPQWQVEVFAPMCGIAPDNVVGMRREIIGSTITASVESPVSYADGKLDAYQLFISRSQMPALVAADSLGDWKLLEWATDVRLLVEPIQDRLREFARWRKSLGESWLIQELD